MEKPLRALVFDYLEVLLHFIQDCVELCRHYAGIVAASPLVLRFIAWTAVVVERPWFQKCCHALHQCAAFIVGSTYEDERAAFSAERLVKNDAYRDRLLVPEIEDLVMLCEALQLTYPQRKAYFQCFLHVDFMRRSTVSRADLLRYCSLRAAPVTTFLLPNAREATHRSSTRYRWDILQLVAVCFSICTADTADLVQVAVAEACKREEEVKMNDSGSEGSSHEQNELETNPAGSEPSLCEQIDKCLAFFIGVADPLERKLLSLLTVFYGDGRMKEGQIDDRPRTTTTITGTHDFQKIHKVATIFDVVRLFPVLVFPCIWVQRVLRTRILGVKTWQFLQHRRLQLQPYIQADEIFLTVSDIVAASRIHVLQKQDKDGDTVKSVSGRLNLGTGSDPTVKELDGMNSARSDGSTSSKRSTPRKIVPCNENEHGKAIVDASISPPHESDDGLKSILAQCTTSEQAWRISANHALASVYILCIPKDSLSSVEDLAAEFERVSAQIFSGELPTDQSDQIRKRLVKDYGYRFAQEILAKSSVKEQNCTSKTPLDERRAKQRFIKAWDGGSLVEDKLVYWKEFLDPMAQKEFYYNVRTGESRWEKPPNYVNQASPKKMRRRKAKHAKAQQESEPLLT